MRINEKSYMNLAKKIQAMLEEEIERNTVTDQTKHVQHTVRISKKFMRLVFIFCWTFVGYGVLKCSQDNK